MRKGKRINRRNFLITATAAGLTPSVAVAASAIFEPNTPFFAAQTGQTAGAVQNPTLQVPMRELGKTGAKISCLSIGGDFSFLDKQIVLRKAVEWGVTCWDTAYSYGSGNAEIGFGQFISQNPDARAKLFLVSKASIMWGTVTAEALEARLQESLKRMNTQYIDLYYAWHGLTDPANMTDEVRKWAESAKQRKLIRFLGFSTHANMANCLTAAAKLGWIDAATAQYNFRLMQNQPMQEALEACNKAGVGVIAMKTLSAGIGRLQGIETEEDQKLAGHFVEKGFTEGQAKIKAVLQDPRIASACVGMGSVSILSSNVAAVLDKTALSDTDTAVLQDYARATRSGYCAGCSQICDAALGKQSRINDVMRYLMYFNSYGDRDRARTLFGQLPSDVRESLLATDYSPAELRCPQRMPIGDCMAEAVGKLA
jgi:uncharacterized protein